MRLARLMHTILLAVANGDSFDAGPLQGFNSGVGAILSHNREATDAELIAFGNLIDQMFAGQEPTAKPEPAPEAVLSATQPEPAEGEEAGGAAAPQAEVTQLDAGQPAPAGISPTDELFQPQSHGEDDGV